MSFISTGSPLRDGLELSGLANARKAPGVVWELPYKRVAMEYFLLQAQLAGEMPKDTEEDEKED